MNIWDKVTGNDIKKEFKSFEDRIKNLPVDYQEVWKKIKENIWQYSDFSGRNLIMIMENVVEILEEISIEGKSVKDALGDDIKGFCIELVGKECSNSFRNKWRKKLNNNIEKKLGK